MAGNWLNHPPDWSVSQGSGRAASGARRRYVMRAPNGRRWEHVSADSNALLDASRALHRLGRCAKGEPLDAALPGVLPEGAREIYRRGCRTCTMVRELKHFTHANGKARSCNGCVARRLRAGPGERPISRSTIIACPACEEPTPSAHLQDVPGVGSACRGCAAEVERAKVPVAEVIVLPSVERPRVTSRPKAEAPTRPRQLWLVGSEPMRLPQASDLGRVRALLEHVAAGLTDARTIGERMGSKAKSAARHATYYRQAAEILGLLETRRWVLTPLGKALLAAPSGSTEARDLLRSAVAGADELGPLVKAVLGHEPPAVDKLIAEVAERMPGLSAATIKARVRATLAWREHLGFASARRKARVELEVAPRAVPVRRAEPAAAVADFSDFNAFREAAAGAFG